MESKIFQNWDTLKLNYFTDHQLKVTAFFAIDRNGKLTKLALEHSSLNDNIDNSALEAVRGAAPFPPLPPGYKDDTLEVHFGFTLEPGH
jgi:protein TonB